jgi:hypothetical protein
MQDKIYESGEITLGWIRNGFSNYGQRVTLEIDIEDISEHKGAPFLELGVVGNIYTGRALVQCGQCYDAIRHAEFKRFAQGVNQEKINRVLDIWEEWNLNGFGGKATLPTEIIEEVKSLFN